MAYRTSDQQDSDRPAQQQRNTALEDLCSCIICKDIIQGASITRCGHHFCRHCIEQWLEYRPDCPACRNPVRVCDLITDFKLDEIVDELPRKRKERVELRKRKLEKQCQKMRVQFKFLEEQLKYLEEKIIPSKDALIKDLIYETETLKSTMTSLKLKLAKTDREQKKTLDENRQISDEIETLRNTKTSLELERAKTAKKHKKTLDEKRRISETLRNKVNFLELELAKTDKEQKQTMDGKRLMSAKSHVTNSFRRGGGPILHGSCLSGHSEFLSSRQTYPVMPRPKKGGLQSKCMDNMEQKCQTPKTELQLLKKQLIPNEDKLIKYIQILLMVVCPVLWFGFLSGWFCLIDK